MVSYYAPPLIGGGINRCFCLTSVCLTSVCLSRTSGVTREQRGLGRLKLAHTGLRHHFQGQKVKGQSHQATLVGCTGRPIWTYSNGDLSICVHDVYRVTTCRPGRGHIVAAARLQLVISVIIIIIIIIIITIIIIFITFTRSFLLVVVELW